MAGTVHLGKAQTIAQEFVRDRLMPVSPPWLQWVIGGGAPLLLAQTQQVVERYTPAGRALGLIDTEGRLDLERTAEFVRGGFNSAPTVTLMGFNFNKDDGEYLLSLLEKYRD